MPLTPTFQPGDLARDEPQPYLWTLNFGPQHPATHTTLRLVLKLDGERVVQRNPRHWLSALGLRETGRASGLQPIRDDHRPDELYLADQQQRGLAPGGGEARGHHHAAALPVAAGHHRRSSRISDHLLCLGAMGLDTGAFTHFIYAFNPREQIYDIFEALCMAASPTAIPASAA